MIIEEQEKVLKNTYKNMLVSASAGSGKTYIMIKYIAKLVCEDGVSIKDLLVLTFTKAAANQMKERLERTLKDFLQNNEQKLKTENRYDFVLEQIDALSVANISTIHSFCEKSIKKYANILQISENFSVIDENMSQKIRQSAFDLALKEYNKGFAGEYFELISAYKNDKNKLREIVFEIEKLVNALADKERFFEDNLERCQFFFEKAIKFLFDESKKNLAESLAEVEKLHVDEFEYVLKTALSSILGSNDIYELSKAIDDFSFPYLPKRKLVGDEVVDQLDAIKKSINKTLEKIKILRLNDENSVKFQKGGFLEKNLLKFYEIYENIENSIKKSQNCVDFYDLEKHMKVLSQQENLFANIKYVFVDEYQDTNRVQERIVKNIAKNSNFIAVGDVKQGIYGFRLASSEIFLKDLEDFQQDENSTVNFLQSNFRSSQKVLDFVNDVFSVCMTKQTAGVDYKNGSMLMGRSEFVDDGLKAVYIDVVTSKENDQKALPKVYSVKEAELFVENKNEQLLFDIKRRINECLSSKISVGGQLRQCKFSDIAVLSRKRDGFFNQLESFLQENSIPVISNSRNLLLEEAEVKVLLNYLKIALNLDDDIALLSVLLSGLGGYSLEEIAKEKIGTQNTLCEIVMNDENQKFSKFKENLEKFRFNLQIFGTKTAFLQLFNDTSYRAYLNLKQDYQKTNIFVDKFLTEIEMSGYDFDLPNLISFFENVDIVVSPEPSLADESILLTTIHNSKGLEYPIVFLIGCDQSLKKTMPKSDIEINEEFGLAVKFYDQDSNSEITTAKMMAIKEFESQKDFVEELMIFYVALTRAKNRLYLFGEEKKFDKFTLKHCDSYFDLIFFALKKQKSEFVDKGFYKDDRLEIVLIDNIEQLDFKTEQRFDNAEFDESLVAKIDEAISFKYKIDDKKNFKLKESVTSLNQKNQEAPLEKYSTDSISFGGQMIEIGNAYHLALKVLDFAKISSLQDLNEAICKNQELLCEVEPLLNREILLKNILLLKEIVCDADKIFKEKEFIMKKRICDLLEDEMAEDKILVQGIVDLFVIKNGKAILVDYKYSNSTNANYLIEKYKNQLKAYKLAIEGALGIDVCETFLLSLKNANLINVNI